MDWMEQDASGASPSPLPPPPPSGRDHTIQLIDTPGHVDFTVEVERSLRVLDGAVAVLDAVAGVEPQTETVWRQADKYGVPRIVYVNKMDRVGADFDRCLQMLGDRLGVNAVPVQLPIGAEDLFIGVIDLLTMKALVWDAGTGVEFRTEAIPAHLVDAADAARHTLVEAVAETSEELMDAYFENDGLTEDQIRSGLRTGVVNGKVVPVLCGQRLQEQGCPAPPRRRGRLPARRPPTSPPPPARPPRASRSCATPTTPSPSPA